MITGAGVVRVFGRWTEEGVRGHNYVSIHINVDTSDGRCFLISRLTAVITVYYPDLFDDGGVGRRAIGSDSDTTCYCFTSGDDGVASGSVSPESERMHG